LAREVTLRSCTFLLSERSLTRGTLALLAALPLLAARPALALQPLDEFVGAAKGKNLDVREAQATADQRGQEARQAWAKIGPNASARAAYTRNQYAAIVSIPMGPGPAPQITIQPTDQVDAFFTLNLPLVDVGAWQRVGSAGATADAARVRAQATGLDAEKAVVRGYFQVVASEATLAAAEKALGT